MNGVNRVSQSKLFGHYPSTLFARYPCSRAAPRFVAVSKGNSQI